MVRCLAEHLAKDERPWHSFSFLKAFLRTGAMSLSAATLMETSSIASPGVPGRQRLRRALHVVRRCAP